MARTVVVLGRRQRFLLGLLLIAAAVYLAYAGELVQAGLLLGAVVRSALPVEAGRPGDSIKVVRRGTRPHPREARRPPTLPPPEAKP